MRLLLITVPCICLAYICFAGAAYAQVREQDQQERRRQFVEDLLRTLVDTRVLRESDRHRRVTVPVRPSPPRPRPSLSSEYRDARRAIDELSVGAGELITALRRDERLSPGIRPYLGDAITFKAMTDALIRRADAYPDTAALAAGLSPIDQHWRVLSHRLQHTPYLSSSSQACLRKLTDRHRRVCQLLKLAPQLDRAALAQRCLALAADIDTLLENVAFDVTQQKDRNELLTQGRKLLSQVNYLASAVAADATRDTVVAQYTKFYAEWRSFAGHLRVAKAFRYLERGIRRADRLNLQIHDLLWIPRETDRAGIAYTARLLVSDFNFLCDRVTLTDLLAWDDGPAAVEKMREFQALCTEFNRAAAGKPNVEDLRWDFRLLYVEWQQIRDRFVTPAETETTRRLALMDETILAMRELLDSSSVVNQETVVELAAEVETLAELMNRDMISCVGRPGRYTPQFRQQAAACSNSFYNLARQFHAGVIRGGPNDATVRKTCSDLAYTWQRFQGYVAQLEHHDRSAVMRHYERFAPAMARLQIMAAY
jgi:hypothetical protein